MRIPPITISLALVAAVSIYVGATNEPGVGLVCGIFGLAFLFIGCQMTNDFRKARVEAHRIARLPKDEFQRLCRENADVRITFYDSVRAGNCIMGTRDFVVRTFRGYRTISLGELLPYCRTSGRVKNVAVYKLIQLSRAAARRPASGAGATQISTGNAGDTTTANRRS